MDVKSGKPVISLGGRSSKASSCKAVVGVKWNLGNSGPLQGTRDLNAFCLPAFMCVCMIQE